VRVYWTASLAPVIISGVTLKALMVPSVNTFQFEMQLRLFRHFVPVSVVLLASSDALLITGAFYQLLSVQRLAHP